MEEKKPANFYFLNSKKWSEVVLDAGKFSTPQRYRGSTQIDFFAKESPEILEFTDPSASVSLSTSWRHALVVLHEQDKGEEGSASLKASCQEWKELEEASMRLVNLTDSALEIVFGSTDVHLAPNQNYDLNLGDFEDLYVPVQMFDADSENRNLAYSKKLRINPEGRMLLMIRREPIDSNRLRVSTLSLDTDEP
ncbi:MAG: hypothetical protein ACON39_04050 [Coraliomargaritaceae bacterium]